MIYLIAMLAASFFVSPVVLLATIIILPIVQLLWLLSDDGVQGAARYLPSMIIGRGNAAQESQRRTEAMRIVNAPFLVWLLIGNLLILPPFIAAFFYESAALVDVAEFLRINFDVTPAWQGTIIDSAFMHAAMIWAIGVGIWGAYFYSVQRREGDGAFAFALLVGFAVSIWKAWPESAPYVSVPGPSAYTLILFGLLCWSIGAIGLDFMRRQSMLHVRALFCGLFMVLAYVSEIGTLPLYLSGWMFIAYAWGKTLSSKDLSGAT